MKGRLLFLLMFVLVFRVCRMKPFGFTVGDNPGEPTVSWD